MVTVYTFFVGSDCYGFKPGDKNTFVTGMDRI